MNERHISRGRLNKIAINLDQNSNENEDSNLIFSSGAYLHCKNSQEQISDSSNCLFPGLNSDFNFFNNNIFETFMTDKVRKTHDNDNEEVLPNVLKPLYLNQLAKKDQKKFDSRGTNRPSFSYSDETPKAVTKYKTIPWGFETSIAFQVDNNDNYLKYMKDQFAQVKEKNLFMTRHNSLKQSQFLHCFNNCINNKLQLTTDIKNLIHNNSKDDYEIRVKLIKDLIKQEMKNRSIGNGVFNSTSKFRAKSINQWKEIATQKQLNNEQNPILINLRKKELFDKKGLDKSADVFFNRNFLRCDYDSYRTAREKKIIEKKTSREYQDKVVNIYEKAIAKPKEKIDLNSHRDRKVMNAIKSAKLLNCFEGKD